MVGVITPWISNTHSASSLPLSSSSSSSSSYMLNSRNSIASLPDLPPASRIFVRNLSYSTGEVTLIKLFSKFGRIIEVKLAKHEDSKKSKGYAFIQYSSQDDAILAMEQMDQKRIGGRTIYAEIAKPVNNGFADYPITSGPPPRQNPETNNFKDHPDGPDQHSPVK